LRTLFFIFLLLGNVLFAQNKLVINTGWYPPNKDLIENILDELFARVNISYSFQQLPSERALRNADLGLDDGDAVRVFEVEEMYSHLHRVNEHFFTASFSAFYIDKSLAINTVDDMKHKNVGIVNGTKMAQKFVRDNKFTKVVKVVSYEEALLKLLDKKIDIIILNHRSASSVIRDMHLEDIIVEHKPSLIQKKMYLYLHKKHEKIIPHLEIELKKMKADGSYQKIIQKYLEQFPSEKGIIDAP